MEKLDSNIVGKTLAVVAAVVSAVCWLLIVAGGNAVLNFMNKLFHGIDLMKIAKATTFADLIWSVVVWAVVGYLIGLLFASVYNTFASKQR